MMAGKWFDELEVGQTFDHPIRRTITETDNVLFTTMTHNPAQLHLDEEYCRTETEFGTRIVNSCYTLSLMVGISVGDTTLGTAVANLGWDDVRFPKPLFHGDTVRIETEVIDLRDSKSRPDQGIVTFEHRAYNQHGDLVASCKRSGLQRKNRRTRPSGWQAKPRPRRFRIGSIAIMSLRFSPSPISSISPTGRCSRSCSRTSSLNLP